MSAIYPGNDLDLGECLDNKQPLILNRRDRARHTYMVGGSRTGKTKLMEGMCRQDLMQWPKFHCPMVVIDPHDTLFDGLMEYAAASNLREWPIVPFDLRRNDYVVSYDLLKKRNGVRPEVVCRSFAEAIIHAWGQSNTRDTPRLASTLLATLMTVYEKECSLSEALAIITDPELRRLLTSDLSHQASRATFLNAQALGEKGFQETMQSMMYRVNAFLSTQIIEATLCSRTGQSLDVEEILKKGKILLVSLSTQGGNIATEDAWALGSIILTDLWSAAKRRGKTEEGKRAPCYVYVDEFQNSLTPDIAIGLTEASGFGLHLTLGHQYPSQLPDRAGDLGKMILNAVLATAKNKIVFQVEHPEDVEMLANIMGRQSIDLNKVKYEIWSTKVVSYKLAYLPAFSESTTEGKAFAKTWSEGHTTGHTETESWSENVGIGKNTSIVEGEGESVGHGKTSGTGTNEGVTDTRGKSHQRMNSQTDTVTDGKALQQSETHGETKGESSRNSTTESESLAFGALSEKLQGQLTEYKDGELTRRGENEEFERKWPKEYTLGKSKGSDAGTNFSEQHTGSKGATISHGSSHAEGSGGTDGESISKSKNVGVSTTETASENILSTRTVNRTKGDSLNVGRTDGGSEGTSEQFSEQYQEGITESSGRTNGISWNPTLLPVVEKELSSRVEESKDEQQFKIGQFIDAQPDRHCLVRLASDRKPARLFTKTVASPKTTKEYAEKWTIARLKNFPFVQSLDDVLAGINARRRELKSRLLDAVKVGESPTARRKIPRPPDESDAGAKH